jgi:Family of unknown function (DUF6600)
MRARSYVLPLAVVGALALMCSPAQAQPYSHQRPGGQIDVGIFYDSLSPYGDWVEMPDYGWSFAPRVERDWRPYTRGQWVMTDDGWFWDSDEQFGWAAYHYGRWINDRYYGWVWVPGTEWAPAWVSWRHGNGYTGWAPLPPRATWQTHIGLNIGGLDIDAFLGSNDYAFVPDRSFVDRGVYQRVLPRTQNVTIINVTNNVTNYTVVNQRVVNGGIAVANVERAVGRHVPRARTVDVDRFDAPRIARAGELAVFRPDVRVAPERRPARGSSLVKGDEPPPRLVERRRVREQERRQPGQEPEVTAKDVAQRGRTDQKRDKAQGQPSTQQQRDQAHREADQRVAKDQAQHASDRKAAQDQAQRDAANQRAKDQAQHASDRKAAQDQAQRDAANQRTKDQVQANERKQAQDQAQQDVDNSRAKQAQAARDQDPTSRHEADQQRGQRQSDAQAQADKRTQHPQPQAKDNAKNKGKKRPMPSPTPSPVAEKQEETQ